MTAEEVLALEDEFFHKAFFPPEAPPLAYELFAFLRINHPHCFIAGGYGIIGIDKNKLEQMAERRGLELVRYEQFVELFIEKALKWQQEIQQSSSEST